MPRRAPCPVRPGPGSRGNGRGGRRSSSGPRSLPAPALAGRRSGRRSRPPPRWAGPTCRGAVSPASRPAGCAEARRSGPHVALRRGPLLEEETLERLGVLGAGPPLLRSQLGHLSHPVRKTPVGAELGHVSLEGPDLGAHVGADVDVVV